MKTQTHSPCESSLKWPKTRSSLLSSSGLRGREGICWRISANLCRKEYEYMNIAKDTLVLPSDSYSSARYQIISLQPLGGEGWAQWQTWSQLQPCSHRTRRQKASEKYPPLLSLQVLIYNMNESGQVLVLALSWHWSLSQNKWALVRSCVRLWVMAEPQHCIRRH